jgi:hypothetical protein
VLIEALARDRKGRLERARRRRDRVRVPDSVRGEVDLFSAIRVTFPGDSGMKGPVRACCDQEPDETLPDLQERLL